MSLEFHLTNYERYRKDGIAAHKGGDAARARFCFLKAAEHLFQVAQASQGRLKTERARRAQELLEMASRLEEGPRNNAAGRSVVQEGEGEEADADGDRFLAPERPGTTFDSIAGLEHVKDEIRLKIIYPYTHRELAEQYGIQGGGGILFYGPPGTGKTMLARAVAGEVECPFYNVKPSEILSKWVGEAEKNLASLFASAREQERAVIFIDEIEALAPSRSENQSSVMARLVPQILAELEGFSGRSQGLLFLGATNEPWSLDPAILRPGRFDERIYVGLPDHTAVLELLAIHLEGKPLAEDVDLERLAQLLEGYSGADIRNLCRKAADVAFKKAIESSEAVLIDQLTLLAVIREVEPSVSTRDLRRFEEYRSQK
ncbi:MAG: ATP-binding protein [Planctomycetota bacterium]